MDSLIGDSIDDSRNVSESAIDMLANLFPHRKRSVLELILRRCDSDLLRAIEHCRPAPSAFKPVLKPAAINQESFIGQLDIYKDYFLFDDINTEN